MVVGAGFEGEGDLKVCWGFGVGLGVRGRFLGSFRGFPGGFREFLVGLMGVRRGLFYQFKSPIIMITMIIKAL